MIAWLVPVFLFLIFGLPLGFSLYPPLAMADPALRFVALCASPLVFTLFFLMISGGLSVPFQKAIIRGKFPRDLKHPVYGPRRLYGLCWTAVFYFSPLYYALLTVPTFRRLLFRVFGYRGNLDFVVYPDTWIRDLPLLEIGKGAYLSNKSTIGTNICLSNGFILVDRVKVDQGVVVGHLAMLAPGAQIEEKAEVGVGVAFGIRSKLGKKSKVGPGCVINHGTSIGDGSEVGTMSYVGVRAVIGDGITLPGGANIPSGAVIRTQEEVATYISSETKVMRERKEGLTTLYSLRMQAEGAKVNASGE
jgi:carbonic anhydrase/acetyltransferase-like protein (isoleucine patch superfamily)